MKRIPASLLFLIVSLGLHAQNDTLRVLFLGNSYTGSNNLPQITQSLASGANKTLIVDSNTPGGFTLNGHSTNSVSLNKIRQGSWDFVILQEQSQIPTIDSFRYNSMYPGAIALNDTIKKYNPCATVAMYMTWGRRFGGQQCDQNRINCSPIFSDFSHMQDSLESAYTEIADSINAFVSPVGIAWKTVIEDTTLVLHTSDNSHPNYSGSYLAACVFHSILWNESPTGSTFSGSLSSPLASYFQTVADSTVFHSYSNWNLDVDKVVANYNYQVYGDSVQFINLSKSVFPSNYHWDFGDGSSSNLKNPYHKYSNNQTYTVSLIVEYCSQRDTLVQNININSVGLESIDFRSSIHVFPNPVLSDLMLSIDTKNLDLSLQIINSVGEIITEYKINNQQVTRFDVAFLPSGLYLLNFIDNKTNQQSTFKVLKK